MDKTFMRFDVSTKKSDECMSVTQDSCKEELVIQREKEENICVYEKCVWNEGIKLYCHIEENKKTSQLILISFGHYVPIFLITTFMLYKNCTI